MPKCDEKIIGVIMVPEIILNEHPMYSQEQKEALMRYLILAKEGDREARKKAEYIMNNPAKIKSSKRKFKHLTPKKKRRK